MDPRKDKEEAKDEENGEVEKDGDGEELGVAVVSSDLTVGDRKGHVVEGCDRMVKENAVTITIRSVWEGPGLKDESGLGWVGAGGWGGVGAVVTSEVKWGTRSLCCDSGLERRGWCWDGGE